MKRTAIIFLIVTSILSHSYDIDKIKGHIAMNETAQALEEINQGIKEDNKNRLLFELRGDIFFGMDEFRRALDDYKAGFRLCFEQSDKDRLRDKYDKVLQRLYNNKISALKKSDDFMEYNTKLTGKVNYSDYERIGFEYDFRFEKIGNRVMGPRSFFAGENNLFIIDNMNYSICKTDLDGKFIKSFGEKGLSEGRLFRPVDIAGNSKKIFITDMYQNILRLICFSVSGDFLWEKKITELDQINSMSAEQDKVKIEGVKDRESVTAVFDTDGNILESAEDNNDFFRIDNITGNILAFRNGELKSVFNTDYPKGTFSRGIIYSESDFLLLSVKVFREKKERETFYDQIIYRIDSKGLVGKMISFDSKLFGDMERSRKYFYSGERNILFISQIQNNTFDILKFKGI